MTLFESWKDSVKLCKPEIIKLFALVTLKSMYEVVRILSVTWFLIPLIFFICFSTLFAGASGFFNSISFAGSVASIFFLIAARPSVGIKDFEYFRVNMTRAIWLILVSVFIGILLMLPLFIPFIVVTLLVCLMPSFFGLTILFYLDFYSDGVLAAFKRAFYMIWYNYPLFIIYIGGIYILKLLIVMPISFSYMVFTPYDYTNMTLPSVITTPSQILIFLTNIVNIGFSLFIQCLIVNLYIKRMHDQFELYK